MESLVFTIDREQFHRQVYHEIANPINERSARALFCKEGKPLYLHITFLRPVTKQELHSIYTILCTYELIGDYSEKDLDTIIEEDLGHMNDDRTTTFEIRCDDGSAAYDCCYDELFSSELFYDGAIEFRLNDEPSNSMQHWLNKKGDM